jgi:tRNA threonylcarbamoyl adenosine modification protein YeaZ
VTVCLALETSSRRPGVAIARDDAVLYDSDAEAPSVGRLDLGALVERALAASMISPSDLDRIAVDIGPGGLNAVRSGVAFANGLAYSLGLGILPVTSFEIIGKRVWRAMRLPVLCVRGATETHLFVGLYNGSTLQQTLAGSLADVSAMLSGLHGTYAVAGRFRQALANALPEIECSMSDVDIPTPRDLIDFLRENHAEQRLTKSPVSAFQQAD